MKSFVFAMVVLTGGVSFGSVVAHFALDTHKGLRQASAGSALSVEYSPDFADVKGDKTARVLVNDAVWAESAVGGTKTFTFGESGLYRFAHQVLVNGAVAEERMVSYAVASQGHVEIPDTWTDVPDGPFRNCDWLTSVVIPPSMTRVSTVAFLGCRNITALSVPAGLNAARVFEDSLGGIRSLTLTGDLACLDAKFLSGYHSLTTLVLPDSLKRIESGAFDACPLLEDITYPSGLEEFGLGDIPAKVRAKMGLGYDANGFMIWNGWLLDYRDREAWSVRIPDGVVGIGRDALSEMHDMDTVEFPEGVRHIGARAFRNDDFLDNLVIPDSVVSIAEDAFRGCSYLQNLTVGEGLVSVGDRAFWGCTQLARFTAGPALETIGEAAFSNCWRMQSVALPVGMQSVARSAFKGCTTVTGVTMPSDIATLADWFWPIVSQIKVVTVPAGVTQVCDNMFAGQSGLTTVNLPEGIVRIGDRAFKGCSSLEAVKLPETVVSLGEAVFCDCTSLAALAMPSSITTMGSAVLLRCTSLKDLTLSRGLTAIPDHAMDECSSLESFTVPEGVTWLGRYFFPPSTRTIYYCGVAPQCDDYAYGNARVGLTNYVWRPADPRTPTGWDGTPTSRTLPTTWPTTGSKHSAIAWWEPDTCDVTFDANGGVFASVSSKTYVCGQVAHTWYALPPFDPTREGCKFNGYWTKRTGGARIHSSTGVALSKPHTLYAQWVQAPADAGPSIAGDAGATVTGDAENGFVVTPSIDKTDIVVAIPEGVDAAKVTVAVGVDVMTVKPNGAKVMIMKGADDIAPHLDIPVRGDGVLAVGEATVKETVVKEVLDPEKGAEINYGSDSQGGVSPVLTTAPTKPGLVYTLHEGTTLNGMTDGDSTIGNGEKWTPEITVKGGKSGFYSIGVTK